MATFNNTIVGPSNENAIEGVATDGRGVTGKSETNYGMRAHSTKSAGIRGSSTEGRGVEGWATDSEGVVGISTNGTGVWGQTEGSGVGTAGSSKVGLGVLGTSQAWRGVEGRSANAEGMVGVSDSVEGVLGLGETAGVRGLCPVGGIGVHGEVVLVGWPPSVRARGAGVGVVGDGPLGVLGRSNERTGIAVYALNPVGGYGIVGISGTVAVERAPARVDDKPGVWGGNFGFAPGVYGISNHGHGVSGRTNSTEYVGVFGTNKDANAHGTLGGNLGSLAQEPVGVFGANYDRTGYAGYFAGNVYVAGTLEKWANYFKIDHPLDPANKYLRHAAVESAEMKNVYDGVAVLDAAGEASVLLPNWFEALNRDFRYQLTSLGAASPELHIAHEICENRFKIAGGKPGGKVSWQVTGIRQDAIALAHPLRVEEHKPEHECGTYLHPGAHGMAPEQGVEHQLRARMAAESRRFHSDEIPEYDRGSRHHSADAQPARDGSKRAHRDK
jgi:hypothetical protein